MHVLRRRGRVRWSYVLPFLFEILLPQLFPSDAARAMLPLGLPCSNVTKAKTAVPSASLSSGVTW